MTVAQFDAEGQPCAVTGFPSPGSSFEPQMFRRRSDGGWLLSASSVLDVAGDNNRMALSFGLRSDGSVGPDCRLAKPGSITMIDPPPLQIQAVDATPVTLALLAEPGSVDFTSVTYGDGSLCPD